ncbi:MAG: ABC transporter ATP-binding protein [Planctomycetaceae bacterium]
MENSNLQAFERVFPRRELFRGKSLCALLLGGLTAVLYLLLLFVLFLLVDVLASGGALDFESARRAEVLDVADDAPDAVAADDRGLLPAVARAHDRPWGRMLEFAYMRIPMLRDSRHALPLLVLTALAVGLLRFLLLVKMRDMAREAAREAVNGLRRMLHRQTLRLGPADLLDREGGQVLRLFTEDMHRIFDGIVRWIETLARRPLELALLLVFALAVDWLVTLQCLLPLLLCWYLVRHERQRSEEAARAAASAEERELRTLAENLRKARIVRGFGMEHAEHEQFQRQLDRHRRQMAALESRQRRPLRIARVLVFTSAALILFVVGVKVLQPLDSAEGLSFAEGALLLTMFVSLIAPLDALFDLSRGLAAGSTAADRVFRYLSQIPEVGQAVGAKFLQPLSKSLRFENVAYALPDRRRLLDGFDLSIAAGETLAVVSLDPLEARCAAYLLPRFIEPQSGRVLIDGEDIAWVTLESLRAEAIFVSAGDPFFSGTVQENIACGNPKITLQNITDAAKTAHGHNFILKLSQGYETMLGERGEQLDAGQRFRLALARALVRNPALLVIEEPAEPLDEDTKQLLDDAYNRITRGRTVVFLPSRLSTVKRADRVAMLYKGRPAAIGPHAEVVKTSAIYRHWEYLRFNEFRHDGETRA